MCSLTVAQGTAVKHRQVQVHAIFFSFFDAHDVVQVDEEEHSIEMHLPYIKKVMAGA